MRGFIPNFMILILALCCASPGWAKKLSERDRARVDTLYEEGMRLLKADSLEAATKRFQAVLAMDKKNAPSYVGLGQVDLKRGDLDAAEKAFMDARRKKHDYAPAYNGLGLVWRERPKGW